MFGIVVEEGLWLEKGSLTPKRSKNLGNELRAECSTARGKKSTLPRARWRFPRPCDSNGRPGSRRSQVKGERNPAPRKHLTESGTHPVAHHYKKKGMLLSRHLATITGWMSSVRQPLFQGEIPGYQKRKLHDSLVERHAYKMNTPLMRLATVLTHETAGGNFIGSIHDCPAVGPKRWKSGSDFHSEKEKRKSVFTLLRLCDFLG